MDAIPSMSELLQHADVGPHWYIVGIHLNLDTKRLDEINQDITCHKQSKMYQLWLDTKAPNTTRSVIIQAIQTVGQNRVAYNYKKWINTQLTGGGIEYVDDSEIDCAGAAASSGRHKNGGNHNGDSLNITHLDDVLTHLRSSHFNKRKWRDLGLKLGLYGNTLNTIEEDHPRNTDRCLQECLSKWLRKSDGVRSKGTPSFFMLDQALQNIEQ